jgi:site-specific recombinase XerD
VSLELRDLDLEGGLIHVRHGKGRKERTVATGKRLRQVLWRYLQLRGREPRPLFVGKGGQALLRTSLTPLLSKLAKRTSWRDTQCGPHVLRRSFAVEFIRAGGDPFRLQILLGHEKLDMTRLYARALSNEDALVSAGAVRAG